MSLGEEATRINEGILRIFSRREYANIEKKTNGWISATDPRTQTAVVAYACPRKLTIAGARLLVEDHRLCESSHKLASTRFLLVCASTSPAAVQFLAARTLFEPWAINDDICDKVAHQYCPTYQILNTNQLRAVEAKYGPSEMYPRINSNDPLARIYGLTKGQVVQVNFTNMPTFVLFRQVVERVGA
jgi:DNA-directed RNA polymerase subunit H (RpoH/RPB5)